MSRTLRLILAAASRTAGAFGLLVGASFVIYITIRSAPGDAIDAISPMGTSPAMKARLLAEFGLDRDPVTGYFAWLARSLTGDFGDSLVVASGESVMAVAWPAFKLTLALSAFTLLACLVLALGAALLLGRPSGRQQVVTGPLYLIGSAPSFIQAVLLSQALNWMIHLYWEQAGYQTPVWYPIPIFSESLMPYVFAGSALLLGDGLFMDFLNAVRAELDLVRNAQFIDAVRAKGARPFGHIARNLVVPITSSYAARLPIVLGGAVIVEYIFTLEGAGYLLLEASRERDFPIVVGISVLFTATVIASTLVAEVVRTVVDPREVARGG